MVFRAAFLAPSRPVPKFCPFVGSDVLTISPNVLVAVGAISLEASAAAKVGPTEPTGAAGVGLNTEGI